MASRTPKPIAQRFWQKVKQSGDCWEWSGNVSGGYGRVNRSRDEVRETGKPRGVQAHRWAYEALVDTIPDGLQLDHLCRNQLCVNPYHLDPVPQAINMQRGAGRSAQNAVKTHCPQGHEYSLENTGIKVFPSGRTGRNCKKCAAIYVANKRAARKAMINQKAA